jgi:hypothetical protein
MENQFANINKQVWSCIGPKRIMSSQKLLPPVSFITCSEFYATGQKASDQVHSLRHFSSFRASHFTLHCYGGFLGPPNLFPPSGDRFHGHAGDHLPGDTQAKDDPASHLFPVSVVINTIPQKYNKFVGRVHKKGTPPHVVSHVFPNLQPWSSPSRPTPSTTNH